MSHLVRGAAAGCSVLLLLAGCTGSSVKTYPVQGQVVIKDGDASILTGSVVELRREGDDSLLLSGKISSGGSFAVETLRGSEILSGAPEGNYKARIILADESDEGVPKRKGNPIHPRFLSFDTSGLSFAVPGNDYSVSLSRK